MSQFERDLGFSKILPQRRETGSSPSISELRRSNKDLWREITPFIHGTIGEDIFPKEEFDNFLAGRKRSPLVMDRPISDLWPKMSFPTVIREIEGMSIRNFLALPSDKAYLFLIEKYPNIKNMLHDYLRNLSISPAVSLLNDILERQQMPVLPQNEEIAEKVLEDTLSRMVVAKRRRMNFLTGNYIYYPISELTQKRRKRTSEILKIHYGMYQGLPQSFADIASAVNKKPGRIFDWVQRGMYNLRRSEIKNRLKIEMPS